MRWGLTTLGLVIFVVFGCWMWLQINESRELAKKELQELQRTVAEVQAAKRQKPLLLEMMSELEAEGVRWQQSFPPTSEDAVAELREFLKPLPTPCEVEVGAQEIHRFVSFQVVQVLCLCRAENCIGLLARNWSKQDRRGVQLWEVLESEVDSRPEDSFSVTFTLRVPFQGTDSAEFQDIPPQDPSGG